MKSPHIKNYSGVKTVTYFHINGDQLFRETLGCSYVDDRQFVFSSFCLDFVIHNGSHEKSDYCIELPRRNVTKQHTSLMFQSN